LLTDKIIPNKIYQYSGSLHKVKKIHKSKKQIVVQSMADNSELIIPLDGAEILLSRLYTIGEVAKIVERRSDTIRKYEKRGLIPKPSISGDDYPSYKGWRFYKTDEVYEISSFFSDRTPGRPVKKEKDVKKQVSGKIKELNQKVKLTNRSFVNAK
jgi:hypothetical protein